MSIKYGSNRAKIGSKVILDDIRFILAKYEPVARHEDQLYCMLMLL